MAWWEAEPTVESGEPSAECVVCRLQPHPPLLLHPIILMLIFFSGSWKRKRINKVCRCRTCGCMDFGLFSRFPVSGHKNSCGKVTFWCGKWEKECSLDTRENSFLVLHIVLIGGFLASRGYTWNHQYFDITTGETSAYARRSWYTWSLLEFFLESQILVTALDDGSVKICDQQHASRLAHWCPCILGADRCILSWWHTIGFSWSDKSVKVWGVGMRTSVHTFFDHQDKIGVKYNGNGSKLC